MAENKPNPKYNADTVEAAYQEYIGQFKWGNGDRLISKAEYIKITDGLWNALHLNDSKTESSFHQQVRSEAEKVFPEAKSYLYAEIEKRVDAAKIIPAEPLKEHSSKVARQTHDLYGSLPPYATRAIIGFTLKDMDECNSDLQERGKNGFISHADLNAVIKKMQGLSSTPVTEMAPKDKEDDQPAMKDLENFLKMLNSPAKKPDSAPNHGDVKPPLPNHQQKKSQGQSPGN